MKVTIGDYIVELSAVSKFSKDTDMTKHFMNEMSIVLRDASTLEHIRDFKGLSERYNKMSNDIYNALKEEGFYYEDNEIL